MMTDHGVTEAGDERAAPAPAPRPYVSAAEYARIHGVHRQTVTLWHRAGRLPGAYKSGGRVFIPRTCPAPPVNESMPANRGRRRAGVAAVEVGHA